MGQGGGGGGAMATIVAAAAGVASGALESEWRERKRAETPIASSPIACEGRRTATRDRLRDLRWSPGNHGRRLDQKAARGDIRAAELRLSPRSACLEVRLREQAPQRLGVSITVGERHFRNTLNVELRDERAVAVSWISEGSGAGYHYHRVRASRIGDTIRVRLPCARLEAGPLRLSARFRWYASTDEVADGRSQWVDYTPSVRGGKHAAEQSRSGPRDQRDSNGGSAGPQIGG